MRRTLVGCGVGIFAGLGVWASPASADQPRSEACASFDAEVLTSDRPVLAHDGAFEAGEVVSVRAPGGSADFTLYIFFQGQVAASAPAPGPATAAVPASGTLVAAAVSGSSASPFPTGDLSCDSAPSTDPDPGEGSTDPDPGEGSTDPDPGEGSTDPDPGEGSTDPDPGEGSTDPDPGEGSTDPDPGEGSTDPDPSEGSTDPDPGQGTGSNTGGSNADVCKVKVTKEHVRSAGFWSFKKHPNAASFTIKDAFGCSVKQVVQAMKTAKVHAKHGTSSDQFKLWIQSVREAETRREREATRAAARKVVENWVSFCWGRR